MADDEGLDLSRYETPIEVRAMRPGDFDAVVALQEAVFPGMKPWQRSDLESHLERFPEGQLVVELEGRVVGSSSSLRLDIEDYDERHTFEEISAGGTIANHDPEGRHLYGIEVMVDPEHQGMRIAKRLYEARKELCEHLGLEAILVAGRMPGYADHADKLSVREYVRAVEAGELQDPVLTFQLSQGFRVRRILQGYLPRDEPSRGHAVLMEWSNLAYEPSRKRVRPQQPVRVCVIQYKMRRIDGFADFARQTEYFVDVAANYRSDFAVFPELLTTQLLSCMEVKEPAEAARALDSYTEQYLEHFQDLAVRYNVNVLGGSHLVEEDGRLLNVAFLFKRDGTIERQEKLHITQNERRWWGVSPGDRQRVLDTDAGKVAIQVCYDVEFPELARMAADEGARILLVPYCTEDRQGHLRVSVCARARAVESQLYVVTAGTVGNLPDTKNMDIQYAQSAIYTPSDFYFPRDGVQAQTDPNVEMVIVGDLDLELLRRHRRAGTVRQLDDRRGDLYRIEREPPVKRGKQ